MAGGAASAGLGHLSNLMDYKGHVKEIKDLLDYMDNMKADNPKLSGEEIFHRAPGKSEWLENMLRGNSKEHVQELLERTMRHKPKLNMLRLGRNSAIAGAGGTATALIVNRIKGAIDGLKESFSPDVPVAEKTPTPAVKETPWDTLKRLLDKN